MLLNAGDAERLNYNIHYAASGFDGEFCTISLQSIYFAAGFFW
jgi:hypothetical protein